MSQKTGRSRLGLVALLVALGALLLAGGPASAVVSPPVTCTTPSANALTITVNETTSASQPLKIGVSSGNYVISLSGCGTYSDSATGGYPNVTVTSASSQYVVLDDSNGQLASKAGGCIPQFTASFSGTLEADGDGSAASSTDATAALGPSTLTLSESCSADVSLGTGVQTVVVDGKASSNSLDLSGAAGPLSIDAGTGKVTGFKSGHVTELDFAGEQSFIGSSVGGNTFIAGSGNAAFLGPGLNNVLDLSGLSTPTVNVSGAQSGAVANDSVVAGAVSDTFSGISAFKGSSTGNTTFLAGNGGGLDFLGQSLGNKLDLSALTSGSSINASAGSASTGSSPDSFSGISKFVGSSSGNNTFIAPNTSGLSFTTAGSGNTLDLSSSSSGASIDASAGAVSIGGAPADTFSGISSFIGSSGGGNTFTAGSGTAKFTATGSGNLLDLSHLSAPTVNVSGAPSGALANDSVKAGTLTDSFSGISAFKGPSTGNTTFLAGNTGGYTFTGQGTGNTLNLSAISAPASLTVAMSGGSCGSGQVTGSNPSMSDCFTDMETIDGPSGVPTTFQPDPTLTSTPTSPVELVGGDPNPGGSVLDLSSFKSPVSGLTVSLHGNSTASPGQVTGTVGGAAVTFATFARINEAIGSSTMPTALNPGSATGIQLIDIGDAAQTITFTSTPPSNATVGETYLPQATGGASGNPVVFSVDPSSGGACTLSGGAVTFTAAGTCRIDANQAGNSAYQSAPQAQQSVLITQPAGTGGGGPPTTAAPTAHLIFVVLSTDTTSATKAGILALLKAGEVTFRFKALEAGTATMAWYLVPSGAHLAGKRKPVLVASGTLAFASAGTRPMQLKLTPAGKKLLRHAKRVKLVVKGTFTPPGGPAVTARRFFRLAR